MPFLPNSWEPRKSIFPLIALIPNLVRSTIVKTQKSLFIKKTPAAFAEIGQYCVVDSQLCISLVKKLNVIGNQIEFANVVYFPLEHLFTAGEMRKIGAQIFVNGFILGFVFEDKPYVPTSESLDATTSGKKYQGARVLEPKIGAYMEKHCWYSGFC